MAAKTIDEALRAQGIDAKAGRRTFLVDPKGIVIPDDENHPLYDRRSKLPLDNDLIESIRKDGIMQAVEIRRDGPEIVVVFGTQRVRSAQFINDNLSKWPGQKKIMVPCLDFKGDVMTALRRKVMENGRRRDDSLFVKAFNCARLQRLGSSDADLCEVFGVASMAPLEKWMSILNFHTKVQDAFDDGTLGADHIPAFAELPANKQPELLKTMKETGATKAHQVRQVARAVAENREIKPDEIAAAKALGRPKIQAIRDELERVKKTPECREVVAAPLALLDFILTGNMKALHGHGELRELVQDALRDKRGGKKDGKVA